MNRLYKSRCLVPAIWVKHQPALRKWVRLDYRHGAAQIQWRWPWEQA